MTRLFFFEFFFLRRRCQGFGSENGARGFERDGIMNVSRIDDAPFAGGNPLRNHHVQFRQGKQLTLAIASTEGKTHPSLFHGQSGRRPSFGPKVVGSIGIDGRIALNGIKGHETQTAPRQDMALRSRHRSMRQDSNGSRGGRRVQAHGFLDHMMQIRAVLPCSTLVLVVGFVTTALQFVPQFGLNVGIAGQFQHGPQGGIARGFKAPGQVGDQINASFLIGFVSGILQDERQETIVVLVRSLSKVLHHGPNLVLEGPRRLVGPSFVGKEPGQPFAHGIALGIDKDFLVDPLDGLDTNFEIGQGHVGIKGRLGHDARHEHLELVRNVNENLTVLVLGIVVGSVAVVVVCCRHQAVLLHPFVKTVLHESIAGLFHELGSQGDGMIFAGMLVPVPFLGKKVGSAKGLGKQLIGVGPFEGRCMFQDLPGHDGIGNGHQHVTGRGQGQANNGTLVGAGNLQQVVRQGGRKKVLQNLPKSLVDHGWQLGLLFSFPSLLFGRQRLRQGPKQPNGHQGRQDNGQESIPRRCDLLERGGGGRSRRIVMDRESHPNGG